jgi:MFS family permease
MLMFMAMAGSYLLLPYYFGYLKGLSTAEYGFILIANSVGMMVSGPLVGRITDRTGDNRMFILIGTLLATLGFIMMMSFGPDTGIPYILLALFVMGAGMGMALVCATNLAYGYITEEENGQLSGQTMTFRQAGSSAGVAILNAVFVANLAIGAGSTAAVLMPGFRHAFFIAVVLSLIAFAVAMSSRNAKDMRKE